MSEAQTTGTLTVKRGLAQMLKGGVIMDVVTPEQAVVAQEAGAVAVMALERIPADIRAHGGVARMSNLELVQSIMDAVTIPVMAKVRIGHFAEAQALQELGIDFIDESEVLTPADDKYHVDKQAFTTPFVCGARDLGEALRRIAEGAAMIRSKGEAGSGNIVEAVRHIRAITDAIKELTIVPGEEAVARARDLGAPLELIKDVAQNGKLPVVLFCAGGVSTPADAALMMQLGAEGIFVGSGIFKSTNPKAFAKAIVDATTHYSDPKVIVAASKSLGKEAQAMEGIDVRKLPESETAGVARQLRSRIGVLALQGDVVEHLHALERAGARAVPVKTPGELKNVDGLIIPGGESTTVMKLLERFDLRDPIVRRALAGMPLWGTCMGMIVIARDVVELNQPSLDLIDISVRRNAFGRQNDSAEVPLSIPVLGSEPFLAIFIRAPWIERAAADVEVLAQRDGHGVMVRRRNVLGTSFHPETHRRRARTPVLHADGGARAPKRRREGAQRRVISRA